MNQRLMFKSTSNELDLPDRALSGLTKHLEWTGNQRLAPFALKLLPATQGQR
jgi:hypothetical protein